MNRIIKQGFEKMSFDKDNVNKLFTQFKNKYVTVDLRETIKVKEK